MATLCAGRVLIVLLPALEDQKVPARERPALITRVHPERDKPEERARVDVSVFLTEDDPEVEPADGYVLPLTDVPEGKDPKTKHPVYRVARIPAD